ncbi:unnamed protein product, partial [Durusdinium trenchii]
DYMAPVSVNPTVIQFVPVDYTTAYEPECLPVISVWRTRWAVQRALSELQRRGRAGGDVKRFGLDVLGAMALPLDGIVLELDRLWRHSAYGTLRREHGHALITLEMIARFYHASVSQVFECLSERFFPGLGTMVHDFL